jgi:hypothetical protein
MKLHYKSEIYGEGGIYAKTVCASVCNDIPIWTIELRYPRFIHSEVMTHRAFSRNASSSRAIPVEKVIQQVESDPACPIHWGKNQPGMQAGEEVQCKNLAQWLWEQAAGRAVWSTKELLQRNVHKQITNRLLEPFQFIKVIVTATEWDNFFNLRIHPDAQPEIQELARCIKIAQDKVEPDELVPGQWHLPYITKEEFEGPIPERYLKLASAGRCARVSYLNHDKSRSNAFVCAELAKKLLIAGHLSPFEHQARPMDIKNNIKNNLHPWEWEQGVTHIDRESNFWSGNFKGWIQYRQTL